MIGLIYLVTSEATYMRPLSGDVSRDKSPATCTCEAFEVDCALVFATHHGFLGLADGPVPTPWTESRMDAFKLHAECYRSPAV